MSGAVARGARVCKPHTEWLLSVWLACLKAAFQVALLLIFLIFLIFLILTVGGLFRLMRPAGALLDGHLTGP